MLFSSDDYPKEAMRHGWQGTVRADLTISARGVVTDCRIVQSSGYEVLDTKTCDILMTRARFSPAKDINGNPTVDTFLTPPIRWQLGR